MNNKVVLPSSVSRSHESELESIKNKVSSEGVSVEDIGRAKSLVSKILSEKELGALVQSINNGNAQINGLEHAVKSSSKKVYESVEGNVLGLITPTRLQAVLKIQEKEQVKKGGPYNLISESIKTVNDNLGHTARIIKAVLQLQLITMAGVLKNAEVETNRAQKLARLSEKLTSSDMNLKELLDYSLELDDFASHIDLKLVDVKNELDSLKADIGRINIVLTSLNASLESLPQKIIDAQEAAEKVASDQLNAAEQRLSCSISAAKTEAETTSAGQLYKAEQSINGRILQIQQNALESRKKDQGLRQRIIISYIIGGIGIICSAVTLVLSLMHII